MDCYLSGNIMICKCESVDTSMYVRFVVFQDENIAVFLYFDILGIRQKEANAIRDAPSFTVNGYESHSSPFLAGVGETLAEAGKALTAELYQAGDKDC